MKISKITHAKLERIGEDFHQISLFASCKKMGLFDGTVENFLDCFDNPEEMKKDISAEVLKQSAVHINEKMLTELELHDRLLTEFAYYGARQARRVQRISAKEAFEEADGLPVPVAKFSSSLSVAHLPWQAWEHKVFEDAENVNWQPCAVCSVAVNKHGDFVPGLCRFHFRNAALNQNVWLFYWIHHKSCQRSMDSKIYRYAEEIQTICLDIEQKKQVLRSPRKLRQRLGLLTPIRIS